MIDLVLVNPNNRNPAPFAALEPPLWLGLIASFLSARYQKPEIVDAEGEGLTLGQTVDRIKAYHSKEIIIVVMGNNPSVSSTPKMVVAEELLKHLPEAKLTGLHPSAMNHPKAILKPFEGCPNVPWGLLPMGKYRAHNWHCLSDIDNRHPYAVLYTSLNCPFTCSYCNIHSLYGNRKLRWRPMAAIAKELKFFANEGIKNIKVWDEIFTLNESRVLQICDIIISEGYDFNIWAYARTDTVTENMLKRMKRAGVNWIAYGFESVTNDKKFVESTAHQAIDMTRAVGINIIANFLFGLPGETENDWQNSLEYAMRYNFEWVNFQVALPYPGSLWWESLAEKPTDWARFGQFHPNMYGDPKAVEFREQAFRSYFTRSEYQTMVRRKFGETAEKHINEMLAWKIK